MHHPLQCKGFSRMVTNERCIHSKDISISLKLARDELLDPMLDAFKALYMKMQIALRDAMNPNASSVTSQMRLALPGTCCDASPDLILTISMVMWMVLHRLNEFVHASCDFPCKPHSHGCNHLDQNEAESEWKNSGNEPAAEDPHNGCNFWTLPEDGSGCILPEPQAA